MLSHFDLYAKHVALHVGDRITFKDHPYGQTLILSVSQSILGNSGFLSPTSQVINPYVMQHMMISRSPKSMQDRNAFSCIGPRFQNRLSLKICNIAMHAAQEHSYNLS